MQRRRQFAQAAQLKPLKRTVTLEVAVESALKGGYCPACGERFGRAVRAHLKVCANG